MKITLSTKLACPVEKAWQEVRTVRLLRYVARPLLAFEPVEPPVWLEDWQAGDYLARMKFLGILPLGKQWLCASFPAVEGGYCVRDNGHGDLARKWDHCISLAPQPDGSTLYTDRVEIEAGLLTPFVWLFAAMFYRYRQGRWRRLVRNEFDYEK
jgi:hypothetical protein